MSEQSSGGTERSEKRERAFKHDFTRAMWDSLPADAKERLREGQQRETNTERGELK